MRVRSVRNAGAITMLAAATLATAVLLGAPAQAGGPTSAFLSNPGTGQTASLYNTDDAYEELGRLVGVYEPTQTFAGKESGPGQATGPGVTVTWLIHDVEPWRVDRIYVGGNGGPWISTQVSLGGSIWEAPVLWHQPPGGKRLVELLGELGLADAAAADASSGTSGTSGSGTDATSGDRQTEAQPPQTVREEPTGSGWVADIGWATGGLAAGVLLTLAASYVRRHGTDESPSSVAVHDGPVDVLAR